MAMRTLQLTSPYMHGDDVKNSQRKLIKGKFLRTGQADGVFGPETARACSQGHWELGFGGKLAQAATYGDTFDRVLTQFLANGDLPDEYKERRKQRMSAPTGSVGKKSLEWLRKHIGDTENPPGSNRVEWASTWYGIIGPWCAMGATRARVEAGSKVFKRGSKYAYVPYIVQDAISARNGLRRTFKPEPGDLVCMDWQGDGVFDHVETVDKPPKSMTHGTPYTTIGCNTSFDDSGSQSNGGACAARKRTVMGNGRTVFVHEVG